MSFYLIVVPVFNRPVTYAGQSGTTIYRASISFSLNELWKR